MVTVDLTQYNAGIFLYKPWRPKGFFQFEIIINVLVSSASFEYTYLCYEYVAIINIFSAGIGIRRQNLMSTDVRF